MNSNHPPSGAGPFRERASSPIGAYLTRSQVAERYPISTHTLAKLASQGKGPRFFKPTDKCLYRPEDIEAWIEAAAVLPVTAAPTTATANQGLKRIMATGGRGRAKPPPRTSAPETPQRNGRKSLPPSANSWLRRTD